MAYLSMRDDSSGKVGIPLPAFLVAACAGRFAALQPHRRLLHFNKVALHGNYSATAPTKAAVVELRPSLEVSHSSFSVLPWSDGPARRSLQMESLKSSGGEGNRRVSSPLLETRNRSVAMTDDKSKADNRERSKVAAGEDYEVQYLADQTGITLEQARFLIRRHGNDRAKLMEEVKIMRG
jgi:hypothetical protein